MQIRIEIDVKPEELRRFLGLPDVAGLQEDLIAFLREKMGAAGEFDPAAFVKGNLDTLRKSHAWQRLLSAAKSRAESGRSAATPGDDEPERTPSARKRSSRARTSSAPRKRASKSASKTRDS